MPTYGQYNAALTDAVNKVAAGESIAIGFRKHARLRMEERGFDHAEVLECLRRGSAYGPELENGEVRANVVHRGIRLRVVVAGLDAVDGDWSALTSLKVHTVMEVA